MYRNSITVAIISVAFLLTGCGVSASQADDAGQGTNTPTASTSASASADAESSDAQDTVAKFGKAYVYEDGLSVTVSAPKKYTPSEYAAGTDNFKHFVIFEVRIVNKTGKTWDPSLFTATVQSSNEEGDEVFDGDLGDSPQTKLLNGREAKFKVAFGVADPKDIVMEVNPNAIDHNAVMFQN